MSKGVEAAINSMGIMASLKEAISNRNYSPEARIIQEKDQLEDY